MTARALTILEQGREPSWSSLAIAPEVGLGAVAGSRKRLHDRLSGYLASAFDNSRLHLARQKGGSEGALPEGRSRGCGPMFCHCSLVCRNTALHLRGD